MSANNASLYETNKEELSKPIDFGGLGQKANQMVEGGGPLQPPVGQAIHGSIQDVNQNVTLGDLGEMGAAAAGLYGLKALWDKFSGGNQQQPSAQQLPPGPVAPPELSEIDKERLKREQIRTQREELRLQSEQGKIERQRAEFEAKQAAQQAKQAVQQQQSQPGSTIKQSELNMVASSEDAKLGKAVAADKAVQASKQQQAATTSMQAAVAPTVEAQQTPVLTAVENAPVAPVEPTPVNTETAKPKSKSALPKGIPEGHVFKEGLGSGDNWLYNTYGAEGRKAILNQFNEGKPAGSYDDALALSKKAQEVKPGPQIPREVARERGIAPPETNYGKLGKTAKVAGAAGLLMTAAQAANAAQQAKQGNTAPGNEFLFNLLGAIPGLGTAFNAATYAGGLGEGEEKELAKRRGKAPTIR